MNIKKALIALLTVILIFALTGCKDKKNPTTAGATVTGGSVEDVFDLTNAAEDGEDPTIDPNVIDGDSGKIDTGKASSGSKKTTVSHNINKETTVSSNITAAATNSGYKIAWQAVQGAKSYNIYRSDSKDGEYKFIGNTSNTYYIDKDGSSKFYYKITIAANSTSNNTVSNSSNFKGNSITYTNSDGKATLISSRLDNAYIAFVRNEYAKKGINCPPGRLAYVKITDSKYEYVFQFDNAKTWNSSTLEQVQIFVDANDKSKYFSFFTKDSESDAYMAARANAEKEWARAQGSDGTSYQDMQTFFAKVAGDTVFQEVINGSY